MGERAPAPYDLDDLGRLLDQQKLLPPGCEARRANSKDVFWLQPGAPRVAVTTDPEFFEENADSLEFWTPGSPAFPKADVPDGWAAGGASLSELLRST